MNPSLPLAAALLFALTGCKSTGVDRAADTAQAMRDMQAALTDAPSKITAVTASLETLTKEGGDMRAEFATFSGDVDKLVAERDTIRSLRTRVEASKATFTSEWEASLKNIQNEDLRKRADERRAAVLTKLDELTAAANDGREQFDPWMQKVLDVRTYLESDLNPGGVNSVQDILAEIRTDASSVNKTIAAIVTMLEQMSSAIAAAKPPAESTPKK